MKIETEILFPEFDVRLDMDSLKVKLKVHQGKGWIAACGAMTDTVKMVECTPAQVGAVLALAAEPEGPYAQVCYDIIRDLFADWPIELMPIP